MADFDTCARVMNPSKDPYQDDWAKGNRKKYDRIPWRLTLFVVAGTAMGLVFLLRGYL